MGIGQNILREIREDEDNVLQDPPVSEILIAIERKEKIFKLRKETGLGLLTCKKCLKDYDWNFEEALANNHKYFTHILYKTTNNE